MVHCGEMSQCHREFGSENLVFIMKFAGKGVNPEALEREVTWFLDGKTVPSSRICGS